MFFMHMPIATGFVRGCRKNYVKWGKFRSGAKDNLGCPPPTSLVLQLLYLFLGNQLLTILINPTISNGLFSAIL